MTLGRQPLRGRLLQSHVQVNAGVVIVDRPAERVELEHPERTLAEGEFAGHARYAGRTGDRRARGQAPRDLSRFPQRQLVQLRRVHVLGADAERSIRRAAEYAVSGDSLIAAL